MQRFSRNNQKRFHRKLKSKLFKLAIALIGGMYAYSLVFSSELSKNYSTLPADLNREQGTCDFKLSFHRRMDFCSRREKKLFIHSCGGLAKKTRKAQRERLHSTLRLHRERSCRNLRFWKAGRSVQARWVKSVMAQQRAPKWLKAPYDNSWISNEWHIALLKKIDLLRGRNGRSEWKIQAHPSFGFVKSRQFGNTGEGFRRNLLHALIGTEPRRQTIPLSSVIGISTFWCAGWQLYDSRFFMRAWIGAEIVKTL